ncbi:MAG: ABC transporter ATP-binding protein [Syntrophobacteria bacterium]
MIKLQNIYKSFNGFPVLRGVSFEVAKGEILALIGRSGSGKSVILKHVSGLMHPDKGHVFVYQKDLCCLRGKDLQGLRSRFGFLFQGGALFDSMTVFDNVAFPLREKTKLSEKEIRDRVYYELGQVGLDDSANKYPAEISGGMVKRAALARALVQAPEIMLFDEPTTGLDPLTSNTIINLIDSCHDRLGFTGIIVTHRVPRVFTVAQKVALLHEGTIAVAGPPEDVMSSKDPVVSTFIRGVIEGTF